ncbi:unnamed protein product, partial [Laminaria digitata]
MGVGTGVKVGGAESCSTEAGVAVSAEEERPESDVRLLAGRDAPPLLAAAGGASGGGDFTGGSGTGGGGRSASAAAVPVPLPAGSGRTHTVAEVEASGTSSGDGSGGAVVGGRSGSSVPPGAAFEASPFLASSAVLSPVAEAGEDERECEELRVSVSSRTVREALMSGSKQRGGGEERKAAPAAVGGSGGHCARGGGVGVLQERGVDP